MHWGLPCVISYDIISFAPLQCPVYAPSKLSSTIQMGLLEQATLLCAILVWFCPPVCSGTSHPQKTLPSFLGPELASLQYCLQRRRLRCLPSNGLDCSLHAPERAALAWTHFPQELEPVNASVLHHVPQSWKAAVPVLCIHTIPQGHLFLLTSDVWPSKSFHIPLTRSQLQYFKLLVIPNVAGFLWLPATFPSFPSFF